jgi:hypothetical protein
MLKRNLISLLLISFFHTTGFCQDSNVFSRQIHVISTNKRIPVPYAYVIISSSNRNLVFATDEFGIGNIHFDNYSTSDSILVSSIGYKTFKSLLSKIEDEICLELIEYKINEVIIRPVKTKTLKLGNLANNAIGSFQIPFNGKKVLFIPNEGITGKIKTIRYYMHDLSNKEFKYRPFKVILYNRDSISGMVGTNLLKKDLIVMLPRKEGNWIDVAISQSNIMFPQSGIFVGLEVMPYNYYLKNGYIKSMTVLENDHNRVNSLSIGTTFKRHSNLDIQPWDYFTPLEGWTQRYESNHFPLIQITIETK